jgi:hypothetical protein
MTVQNFDVFSSRHKENIIRGLLNLLPKGQVFEKLIFSKNDSERSNLVDRSFDTIKTSLCEISLQLLKATSDSDEIKNILNNEINNNNSIFNNLIESLTELLNQNRTLAEEIKSNKEEFKTLFTKESNNIVRLLTEKDYKKDKSILKPFIDSYLELLENKLQNLELEDIISKIRTLKRVDGFKELDFINQNELISYEAQALLILEENDTAEYLTKLILKSGEYSIRICDYLIYYSTIIADKKLFDEVLIQYKLRQRDPAKIALKNVFWYYTQNNYSEIVNILFSDFNMLQIKDVFTENGSAYFYAGLCAFEKKRNKEAQRLFELSYNIRKVTIAKYYLILAKAFIIIDKNPGLILRNKKDKKELEVIYKELSDQSVQKYFSQAGRTASIGYWYYRLAIALYYEKRIALEDYSNVPQNINSSDKLKLIYADILLINGAYAEANRILIQLFTINPNTHVAKSVLNSFLGLEKYKEILEFADKIHEYDENGIIASLIIESYAKLNPNEDIEGYAKEFIIKTRFPCYIYNTLGKIYFEKGNIGKAREKYKIMISTIPTDNYLPRLVFAEHLINCNLIDIALKCLEPYLNYSYEAQKLYVCYAIKTNEITAQAKTEQIINKYINDNEDAEYWLKVAIDLSMNQKKYNTSLMYVAKLFKLRPTAKVAYNYAYIKLILKENEYSELVPMLENDTRAVYIMMAANCCYAQADYGKAEYLSLKAMAHNGNCFNATIFYRFICNNLIDKASVNNEIELNEVDDSCAILLKNATNEIWIAITSLKELIIEEKESVFANIKIYYRTDKEVINLIGETKEAEIIFNEKEWRIKEIMRLKTVVFRYCFEELGKRNTDNKYFQIIKADISNPLESMKPLLAEAEIYEQERLAQYNFKDGLGRPLNIFGIENGKNLIDVILYLLKMPNQAYYTGEVSVLDLAQQRIILSASAIINLYLLDLLEKAIDKYGDHLIISESTNNYFISAIDHINTKEHNNSMTIAMNKGQIIINKYLKDDKKKRLDHFKKIHSSISRIRHFNIDIQKNELDEQSDIISLLSKMEYENVKYSKENGYMYVVDDLFIRKYCAYGFAVKTTNSVSLIYGMLMSDISQLLNKIEQLSKGEYSYLYNSNVFIKISDFLITKNLIIGEGSLYQKLLNIIHNSLQTQIMFFGYLKIIADFINYLYSKRYNKNALYLIETIIKDLWFFNNIYNPNENYLYPEIIRICNNDKEKILFFDNILLKLNKLH